MAPATMVAQTAPVTFRIPAGDMDEALRAYSRITGRQILFRPQDVRGRRSPGVQGSLNADVALAAVIGDTGLRTERPSPNVIVVRNPAADIGDADTTAMDAGNRPARDVVVTGSTVRGGAATGPVRVIGRREFDRSGKATIADAIAAQTANFGGSGSPVSALTGIDQASLNYPLTPAANLRALGTDATLTLFDGRRVAGSGGRGDFVDLSAIPSLAVDRVEILTDGASAIYGSDAIAGVVNIIMRRRFDGFDMRSQTLGALLGAAGGALAGRAVDRGGNNRVRCR